MSRQSFGALSLDLPSDWEDQSLLTFIKRPKGRMATAAVQDMTRNLVINRIPADGSFTAEDLADLHFDSLRASIPDLEVLREESLEVLGAPAVLKEVSFSTPTKGVAQQLQVFVVLEELALSCVGTGNAGMAFQTLRKDVLGILDSLELEGGA